MFGNKNEKKMKKLGSELGMSFMSNIISATEKATNVIMQGVVDAGALNIRTEPKKDSAKAGKLSRGMIINVTENKDGWLRFNYNGKDAFVSAKYVRMLQGVVTAGILNVRDAFSYDGAIIGKLKKNDKVNIMQRFPKWFKIDYEGKTAFVSAKYIVLTVSGGNNKPNGGGGGAAPDRSLLRFNKNLIKVAVLPKKKVDENQPTREGKMVARTYNKFGGILEELSDEIGIDVAAALAVLAVESGGKGFGKEGKVIIRFENHLFYRFWGKFNEKVYNKHFKYRTGGQSWKDHAFRKDKSFGGWEAFHGNQMKEWEVLNFARTLDNEKALMCASYGAPQVLGTNFKMIGYKNPQDLLDHFEKDIRYHIIALFDILSPSMIDYIRKKEFVSFARRYNGRGKEHRYGKLILNHYNACKKAGIS